jgi:hypothetical protein
MRTTTLVCSMLLSGAALGAYAQERVKAKGPADFDSTYAAVGEHWKAGRWGQCYQGARELMGVVSLRRAKAIREAMPVPAGLTVEAQREEQNAQQQAVMAAFTAGVGSVIEQVWKGDDGKQVRITVTADSPMLQMFRMVIQNPAMLQKNQELVKYAECQAVLETEARRVTLRFMLEESMIEAEFQGYDADGALVVMNQAAVTKLNAAIAN